MNVNLGNIAKLSEFTSFVKTGRMEEKPSIYAKIMLHTPFKTAKEEKEATLQIKEKIANATIAGAGGIVAVAARAIVTATLIGPILVAGLPLAVLIGMKKAIAHLKNKAAEGEGPEATADVVTAPQANKMPPEKRVALTKALITDVLKPETKFNFEQVGVFRECGNKEEMDEIEKKYLEGKFDHDTVTVTTNDTAVLIKRGFQELNLFEGKTDELIKIIDSLNNGNNASTVQALKKLIDGLPDDNKEIIKGALEIAVRVNEHIATNATTSKNLGISMASLLLTKSESDIYILSITPKTNALLTLLIEDHYKTLFPEKAQIPPQPAEATQLQAAQSVTTPQPLSIYLREKLQLRHHKMLHCALRTSKPSKTSDSSRIPRPQKIKMSKPA